MPRHRLTGMVDVVLEPVGLVLHTLRLKPSVDPDHLCAVGLGLWICQVREEGS